MVLWPPAPLIYLVLTHLVTEGPEAPGPCDSSARFGYSLVVGRLGRLLQPLHGLEDREGFKGPLERALILDPRTRDLLLFFFRRHECFQERFHLPVLEHGAGSLLKSNFRLNGMEDPFCDPSFRMLKRTGVSFHLALFLPSCVERNNQPATYRRLTSV